MMYFDLTKNLSKYFVYNNPLTVTFWMNFKKNKKKKNQQIHARSKKLATVFKFIGKSKNPQNNNNNQVPNLNFLNTPRNSGMNQKFFFQTDN